MATDAIVLLERLRCFRESDGSGHSEPYIWPVLIWIDDDTLATPELVGVTAPAVGSAREVIKSDMRAGQVADIPASVNTLRVRLDDNQNVRRLILAVGLWENDETPEAAMRAGYSAFVSELGRAIADNLLALNSATTDEERQPIIDEITRRVRQKVEAAIRDNLTSWQKVRVAVGTLNLDDFVDSDFKSFAELANQAFTLNFANRDVNPSDRYRIEGRLQAVRVRVDLCQAQVDRVRAAQATVNGIESEIAALQAQLRGQGGAGEPSLPKAFIIQEIRRLREEELGPAEAELQAARDALTACRNRRFPILDAVVRGGALTRA
jgi:hypothetical protein